MFEKLLTWLTTAFDAFALGAAIAIGLKLFAPETSGLNFLQSAWMCLGIATACWAVMVGIAAARARLGTARATEILQLTNVRTAEREGHDGVYFCLDGADGRHEFILSRGALEGLIDGDFPTRQSMLLAFEVYRERIVRTAAASMSTGQAGPTLLTPGSFGARGMRAVQPPAVSALRTPRYSS